MFANGVYFDHGQSGNLVAFIQFGVYFTLKRLHLMSVFNSDLWF